jgi:hypothetical protein
MLRVGLALVVARLLPRPAFHAWRERVWPGVCSAVGAADS